MFFELSFYTIICNSICFKCLCHSSIRICFSCRTEKMIFVHQASYFLMIHTNAHVQQAHINSPDTFIIATELICLQNKLKIQIITNFCFSRTVIGRKITVIPGSGNPCQRTEFLYCQKISGMSQSLLNKNIGSYSSFSSRTFNI